IRFVIRDDKKLKDGKSPIQLVYQIKGQRKYYQTGQSVFSSNWNNDDQEAVYLDKKACKKLMPEIKPDDYLTSTEIDDLNKKLEEL
ncbi:Arm DNA-binding domain-containing protein, partial [Acinetobacter baumannii]